MSVEIDPEELRKVIRETVHETLLRMGFDAQQAQRIQADMLYLRRIREGSEDMVRRVRASIITVLVSTVLFLLWQAVRDVLK